MENPNEITLRQRIDELRASGRPMDVGHAIGLVVALAAELADQHRQGYHFFLYPGALFEGQDQKYHASSQSAHPPTAPADAACIPPESQGSTPGGARQSVYGVAAILYELITLQSVGQGMRRPSEIAPDCPPDLDMILTKALVPDPHHRPDDLNALAQAFYQIQPQHSIAPPPADIGHLDHDEGFDVDVSMSLLPPAPSPHGAPRIVAAADAPLPPGVAMAAPVMRQGAPLINEKESLVAVKARLEADPRPRYVVVRMGMDHGPFRAVELLQQIASHTFEEDDLVKDSVDRTEMLIKESSDFAPFARHARMGRHEKAEKAALEASVAKESRSTFGKAVIGLGAVLALVALGGFMYMQTRGKKSDEIAVIEDTVANVESEQGLKVSKKGGKAGGGVTGTVGGFPQLSGGMSCEAAQAAYVQEMKMGEKQKADLTVGQLGAVLNTGSYLNACGVPSSMSVSICAAIQNGRAVGVTVTTTPANGGISGCVSRQIRNLRFPSNPKLDITRTRFDAQ
jgi:eukaryotic-like serine/threonine-protein kinase